MKNVTRGHNIIKFAIILLIFCHYSVGSAAPVKIGMTLGISGKYSKMASMNQMGLKLWQEKVNNQGGLLGRNVELIIYDDQSNKERAVQLYKKLITQDKVDILLGPYSSGITAEILPITEKHRYPVLVSGAAADSLWEQGYQYAFGIFIPASRYAVGFLEMAALQGIDNVAIVYADDTFSSTMAKGTQTWAKKFGMSVKFFKGFKKGTHDLIFLAKQVMASSASCLVVCGHFDESVDMLKAMKQISLTPKAYFATIGPTMPVYHEQLKGDADFTFSSSQWEASIKYQKKDHEIFLEPFKAKYNFPPSYHAAVTFAAGQIIEAAVQQTKSLDREKMRYALGTMDAMSIIGRYKVDKTGKQVRHFLVTTQLQRGKNELVWPESLATSRPIFQ